MHLVYLFILKKLDSTSKHNLSAVEQIYTWNGGYINTLPYLLPNKMDVRKGFMFYIF